MRTLKENNNGMENIKYEFHLFMGGGGGILGGMLCGHTCIGGCEIEESARKMVLARQRDGQLPRFDIWDDITTFRSDNPECADYFDFLRSIRDELVICGGFPCQDISSANSSAVGIEGERSGLWKEMLRIVGEVRPRAVFAENSPRLVDRGLALVTGGLAEVGYDSRWCVLGSHHAGGHCKGERLWLMASPMQVGGEGWNSSERKSDCDEAVSGQRADRIRGGSVLDSRADSQEGIEAVAGTRTQSLLDPQWEELQRRKDWNTPPKSIRVGAKLANRVDRIAAVGNGQDPVLVKLAWDILSS